MLSSDNSDIQSLPDNILEDVLGKYANVFTGTIFFYRLENWG